MDEFERLSKISDSCIDERSADLHQLSLKIWNKPELGFQEEFAHKLLTETLRENGFDVTPQFTLPTAFRAVYDSDNHIAGKGLTAGIICEYDALPGIGHACGHNLIAEAGIAAGLGLCFTFDANSIPLRGGAKVTICSRLEGTQNEKVVMLR